MRTFATAALCGALTVQALAAIPPLAADPEIQTIVSEISPERIQKTIYILTSFKTRSTLSDQEPSGDGIGAAEAWIRAEMNRIRAASGDKLRVEEDSFVQAVQMPRIPRPTRITNVVATLPGSRPGSAARMYVVAGHYDSIPKNVLNAENPAPGANDDASGVACTLELARVMSQHSFPATLVFIAFAGEEQGLNGSAHWAQQARARGLQIEGMLNNDIIGSSRSASGVVDRHTVRLFAEGVHANARPTDEELRLWGTGGENDSAARELARAIKDLAAVYVPDMNVRLVYRMDRYHRAGDHASFLRAGYPAVRFTQPAEDYRHEHEDPREENGVTYGDTVAFVDYNYIADVTRVNACTLAGLAKGPGVPSQVQVENFALVNDTTLRWKPSGDPSVAGYRIVWRETTAPYWQDYKDVGSDVTRVSIPLSKDDLIFGVEAFDAAGHFSQAVYPSPRSTL